MAGPGRLVDDDPRWFGDAVKLGNHVVGLRKKLPGAARDEYGAAVPDVVDVKVRWCLVAPARRTTSDSAEPEDRSAPMTSGYQCLMPPGTDVTYLDEVVWPITGEATVGGFLQLSGRVWQVIGEPGLWDESVELRLRASA